MLARGDFATPADWTRLTEMVTGALVDVSDVQEYYLPPQSLLIDDPAMIARQIESTIGPWEFHTLHTAAASHLLASPLVGEEQHYALLHALGRCGSPAQGVVYYQELMKTNAVVEAVFRAHWQWPCAGEHLNTCLKLLEGAPERSAREAVAIECLAQLDAAPRIPAEVMNRWFVDNVVNDPGARRRILTLLSLQPSGRAFLVEWQQAAAGRSELAEARSAVVRTLHARANATLQTERYDFMAPEECQRLLQLKRPRLNRRLCRNATTAAWDSSPRR